MTDLSEYKGHLPGELTLLFKSRRQKGVVEQGQREEQEGREI